MMMLFLSPHPHVTKESGDVSSNVVKETLWQRKLFLLYVYCKSLLPDLLVSKHLVRMNCAAGILHKKLALTSPAKCAETGPLSAQNPGPCLVFP